MSFTRKRFTPASDANTFAASYRRRLARHPFLLFGAPFLAVMVAGSFVLTPATAVRYERHDRKVRQLSKDEELGLRRNARKVDMKDEYYGLAIGMLTPEQRLAAKDIDNWEQRRVERLPGEHNGIIE